MGIDNKLTVIGHNAGSVGKRPRDRRWARTQSDLLAAFRNLALSREYDDITVSDIIKRGNVGRSTFYEHCENKDDLFRQSLRGMVKELAITVGERSSTEALATVLEHVFERRKVAVTLLRGSARNVINGYLACEIEGQLAPVLGAGRSDRTGAFPTALIAAQIAEAQCGLLFAWLSTGTVDARRMARALAVTSSAVAAAYRDEWR